MRMRMRKRERKKNKRREMYNMVALFLFLKGMTGALAPFSYLVIKVYLLENSNKNNDVDKRSSLFSRAVNDDKKLFFFIDLRSGKRPCSMASQAASSRYPNHKAFYGCN